jgi:antitoxin ParD1/3/4
LHDLHSRNVRRIDAARLDANGPARFYATVAMAGSASFGGLTLFPSIDGDSAGAIVTIFDKSRQMVYILAMASLNISMPNDMRDFVDRRTEEGGFSTPTEYLRSLIRDDRRRAEHEVLGPLIVKWLGDGQLTAEEEASLPAGLLDRVRRHVDSFVRAGLTSGSAGKLVRQRLERSGDRARKKVANRKKKHR